MANIDDSVGSTPASNYMSDKNDFADRVAAVCKETNKWLSIVIAAGAFALAVLPTAAYPQSGIDYFAALKKAKSLTSSVGVRVDYPSDFTCKEIVSDFGAWTNIDRSSRGKVPHNGIDVYGKTVVAAADGIVIGISSRPRDGNTVTIFHNPDQTGRKGVYAITIYGHVANIYGKHSAYQFIDRDKFGRWKKTPEEEEPVFAYVGRPIALVGGTGSNLRHGDGTRLPDHLELAVWHKRDSYWKMWSGITDGKKDEAPWFVNSYLGNPHDFGAPHPDDKSGEVKYIPFVREGGLYTGEKGGFIFPVACPVK